MARWTAVVAVVLVAAAASPFHASAPDTTPLDPRLAPLGTYFRGPNAVLSEEHEGWRVSLCGYETRGEARPDDALSGKNAVGRCQVMLDTAERYLGFGGPTYALFFRHVNEEASRRMFRLCLSRRGWRRTLLAVAYCYHGGHRRRYRETFESYDYAIAVEAFHRDRLTKEDRP